MFYKFLEFYPYCWDRAGFGCNEPTLRRLLNGGGGGCCSVPVWEGDGTKIAPPRNIFDQPPCERSSSRSKPDDHVGDHVFLSPVGTVLVISPGGGISEFPHLPNC